MRILLQNKRTLNFVQGTTDGPTGDTAKWTLDHEKARVFGTGLEAIFFCLRHHIASMQIFGVFADRRMDFTVPVTDLRGE